MTIEYDKQFSFCVWWKHFLSPYQTPNLFIYLFHEIPYLDWRMENDDSPARREDFKNTIDHHSQKWLFNTFFIVTTVNTTKLVRCI